MHAQLEPLKNQAAFGRIWIVDLDLISLPQKLEFLSSGGSTPSFRCGVGKQDEKYPIRTDSCPSLSCMGSDLIVLHFVSNLIEGHGLDNAIINFVCSVNMNQHSIRFQVCHEGCNFGSVVVEFTYVQMPEFLTLRG